MAPTRSIGRARSDPGAATATLADAARPAAASAGPCPVSPCRASTRGAPAGPYRCTCSARSDLSVARAVMLHMVPSDTSSAQTGCVLDPGCAAPCGCSAAGDRQDPAAAGRCGGPDRRRGRPGIGPAADGLGPARRAGPGALTATLLAGHQAIRGPLAVRARLRVRGVGWPRNAPGIRRRA